MNQQLTCSGCLSSFTLKRTHESEYRAGITFRTFQDPDKSGVEGTLTVFAVVPRALTPVRHAMLTLPLKLL